VNTSIRKVTLVLALAFVALFVNLNYIQLGRSTELSKHPLNRRLAIDEEKIKRGEILAADGTLLAESIPSDDESFVWKRRYPQGALFGQITGWYTSTLFCDNTGVEATQNDYLSGREPKTTRDFVDELLGRQRDGNRVRLTVVPELQKLARAKLGKQIGGAAVINTRTGGVLALYGNPTFDPNLVTNVRLNDCDDARDKLERTPNKVLISRAYQTRYPAGSTYKIITAAAGLELGGMTLQTSFRSMSRMSLPGTNRTLGNFGGSFCGGSMLNSFRVSCNTAFAQLALRIGLGKLNTMSERFGLNAPLPFDLRAVPSCVASPPSGFSCDTPTQQNAFPPYVGIGQQSVGVTPLQMALVAAAVENGGLLMQPHVVDRIIDAEKNSILERVEPKRIRRVMSKRTSDLMRRAMIEVVRSGTGTVVGFRDGRRGIIGGKTGTAQTGRREPPHVWFVAWGPKVAVAVVVENGGSLASEATGGRVAGPIAKALLEYAMANDLV
jgi:peptidoglycan glycosyltransferase